MTYEMKPLPYAQDALEPYLSKEVIHYHYDKRTKKYYDVANEMVKGTIYEGMELEKLLTKESLAKIDSKLFIHASQAWNHTFYWHSLSPNGGGEPHGELAKMIVRDFGTFYAFKAAFTKAALTQFGSGWAWLVKNGAGELEIVQTCNAGNPLLDGKKPLLTCDVWEHAYYIDTRNDRAKYVEHFWNLVSC